MSTVDVLAFPIAHTSFIVEKCDRNGFLGHNSFYILLTQVFRFRESELVIFAVVIRTDASNIYSLRLSSYHKILKEVRALILFRQHEPLKRNRRLGLRINDRTHMHGFAKDNRECCGAEKYQYSVMGVARANSGRSYRAGGINRRQTTCPIHFIRLAAH